MTETRPNESSRPRRRSTRSDSSIAVSVSFFACVYQSPSNGSTSARRACEVELAHEVLTAEVEVDGALVHRRVGAFQLGQAEHGAAGGVDDEECVGRRRAKRRAGGGRVLAGPDPAARGVAQLRHVRRPFERLRAERHGIVLVDRRFERGGGDVPVEHARVGVVEDRRLDVALEQRRWLAHEVLVERVLGGDEDREAVIAAAGASPLLAEARDGAREAD